MGVAILVTGGTFDKEYNELTGELFFKGSHVREMLALGRSRLAVRVEVLMMNRRKGCFERVRRASPKGMGGAP